jgi:hypothetical protein
VKNSVLHRYQLSIIFGHSSAKTFEWDFHFVLMVPQWKPPGKEMKVSYDYNIKCMLLPLGVLLAPLVSAVWQSSTEVLPYPVLLWEQIPAD